MNIRITALISISLLLAACAAPESEEDASTVGEEGAETPPSPAVSGSIPDEMGGTAWRTSTESGARLATYLDADGTYRDLRNGDPYGTGSWVYTDGARGKLLCFTPSAETDTGSEGGETATPQETCWETSRVREGKMVVTGPGGKRVELTSIAYAPASSEEADEQ